MLERMTVAEQLRERLRQWAEFNRWEAEHPPAARDPAGILADLGVVWSWLPPEVRSLDPDPEKRGIQAMRAALRRLSP